MALQPAVLPCDVVQAAVFDVDGRVPRLSPVVTLGLAGLHGRVVLPRRVWGRGLEIADAGKAGQLIRIG
ncbi:hypothetical protein ACLUXG_07225, partial [Bifidobacterium apri]|uniref:hypothetical protein n=1 Tax=Bifidobacterium apri TaxID=1769423 RepID=UPI003992C5EF